MSNPTNTDCIPTVAAAQAQVDRLAAELKLAKRVLKLAQDAADYRAGKAETPKAGG